MLKKIKCKRFGRKIESTGSLKLDDDDDRKIEIMMKIKNNGRISEITFSYKMSNVKIFFFPFVENNRTFVFAFSKKKGSTPQKKNRVDKRSYI